MVLVIDYGIGNLGSFTKALSYLSLPFQVSADPASLQNVKCATLIGVGNFGGGMAELRRRGFEAAIKSYVESKRGILFGVCVGMQLLFEGSEEAPGVAGLGLLPGRVRRLSPQPGAPVPHVGFDEICFSRSSRLTRSLSDKTDFYFTHSYAVVEPPAGYWIATCQHGSTSFVAALEHDGIAGVQFHPEKSQSNGLALLRNVLGEHGIPAR